MLHLSPVGRALLVLLSMPRLLVKGPRTFDRFKVLNIEAFKLTGLFLPVVNSESS